MRACKNVIQFRFLFALTIFLHSDARTLGQQFAPTWSDRVYAGVEHYSWDNNTVSLPCGVMSLPEPQFKWFKAITRDGTSTSASSARGGSGSGAGDGSSQQQQKLLPLQELSNPEIRMQRWLASETPEGQTYQGPYVSSLLVRTISPQDYGTYVCRAENDVTRRNESQKTAAAAAAARPMEHQFVVIPATLPPPPIINVLNVSDTFAILRIIPPELPGMYPQIIQYQVQAQRVTKVASPAADEDEATAEDAVDDEQQQQRQLPQPIMLRAHRPMYNEYLLGVLEPDRRYIMRVRSRNAVGIGAWSGRPNAELTTLEPQANSTKADLMLGVGGAAAARTTTTITRTKTGFLMIGN